MHETNLTPLDFKQSIMTMRENRCQSLALISLARILPLQYNKPRQLDRISTRTKWLLTESRSYDLARGWYCHLCSLCNELRLYFVLTHIHPLRFSFGRHSHALRPPQLDSWHKHSGRISLPR